MSTDDRPDWLSEPCPAWCSGDHRNQEHPADRRHESAYLVIPIIQPLDGGTAAGDAVEADELNIVAVRRVGARETWVALASESQALEVSAESASRLHDTLGTLLSLLNG